MCENHMEIDSFYTFWQNGDLKWPLTTMDNK